MSQPTRRHPWVRLMLTGLAISAATLALLFLALELLFRMFFPQPLYATALAPWGPWHQPNVSFVHGSDPRNEGKLLRGTEFLTHISYNSLGIRGPEYAIPKPTGVKRLVILGDSFGDAMEVEFPETMGQVLQRTLEFQRARLAQPVATAAHRVPTTGLDLPELLWSRLRDEVVESGSNILVASLRITANSASPRAEFFDRLGIERVSLDLDASNRFRYNGHWNAKGNANAAQRVFDRVTERGLLRLETTDRVEVVNLSGAALVTCQYVHIFDLLGRRLDPDLVVVIDSGTDSGTATSDLCKIGPSGDLTLQGRSYGAGDQLVRNARSFVRLNSYFLTWVFGLIDRLPGAAGADRVPAP